MANLDVGREAVARWRLAALRALGLVACMTVVTWSGAARAQLDAAACLACHGNEGFSMPGADGKPRALQVRGDGFRKSVHGSLACVTCHQDITALPHPPNLQKVDCGTCHGEVKTAYLSSVHASAAQGSGAATCAGCHTAHYVEPLKSDAVKLALIDRCGACHKENLKTFIDTYHGQVTSLGRAYTATCSDCHGSHGIRRASDPASTVHPDNRLRTCQKCHTGAGVGFVTFQPHANTHDFGRYPAMWITGKFMTVLVFGVFLFFWTHCVLWFYREYRDRKEGKGRPHVSLDAVPPHLRAKHYERFTPMWRWVHLVITLSLMLLALSGMVVMYSAAPWAESVSNAIGGPKSAALIHRVSGAVMWVAFLWQLAYFIKLLTPQWRTFKWFGHTSLVPGPQDLWDMIAMFKWFFGKGPRPVFGRWSYWERFDYWAPFWGMAIIGGSGLMLWFSEFTARFLPGWTLNVAALAHGEEAFLAIVFLFTVHFFNNHFRPDKVPPPDITMFTGTQPLEEFAREHALEYEELVRTGQLEEHLVSVPSRAMTVGSKILGLVLLAIGLLLLVMAFAGLAHQLGLT